MPEIKNRASFFSNIKAKGLFKTLSQPQIDGINAILDYWAISAYTDLRWLAYMFATVYWECAQKMQPIEEYGKGAGHAYGKKIKRSGIAYTIPDKIYYGRGWVQLTWYENYETMGRLLNIDLLNHPELCLRLDVATKILFEGMTKGNSHFGDFTGKSLEDYFNVNTEDWVNARRIINGQDQALKIANFGKTFYQCLTQ